MTGETIRHGGITWLVIIRVLSNNPQPVIVEEWHSCHSPFSVLVIGKLLLDPICGSATSEA